MYYCYIVRCADNSLYCGQTTDLDRRIGEHNNSISRSAKYLRAKKPVVLVYFEEFNSLSKALQREIVIKKMTKAKKEALVVK